MSASCQIRWATPSDEGPLLALMQALAEFEGYQAKFCVTEPVLTRMIFDQQSIQVLVAEDRATSDLIGMLVFYSLPFSYDLKPWWYIKELYVEPAYRSEKVGQRLMESLIRYCKEQGSSRIRWDVLADNHRAQQFYQKQGATHNDDWLLYSIGL